MEVLDYSDVCISLEPNLYLIPDDCDDDLILDKIDSLILILEDLKLSNVKFLYNSKIEDIKENFINLLNYEVKDPSMIYIFEEFDKYLEIIEKIETDSIYIDSVSLNYEYSDNVKSVFLGTLRSQLRNYNNTIVFDKIDSLKILKFFDKNFYFTNSLCPLQLPYESLKEIKKSNVSNLFYLYHWYFDKSYRMNIVLSKYVIKNIKILEVNFLSAIISLLRSIYYPDYMLKQSSETVTPFTIECHPHNKCAVNINKKNFTPYRLHVVKRLNTRSSKDDRIFYIKNKKNYIFIGISNDHSYKAKVSDEILDYIVKEKLI